MLFDAFLLTLFSIRKGCELAVKSPGRIRTKIYYAAPSLKHFLALPDKIRTSPRACVAVLSGSCYIVFPLQTVDLQFASRVLCIKARLQAVNLLQTLAADAASCGTFWAGIRSLSVALPDPGSNLAVERPPSSGFLVPSLPPCFY